MRILPFAAALIALAPAGFAQTASSAGTEGSIVNHVGFKVRDMKDILDKVAAAHFTIQVENPNKDNPTQAFILGPDDIRIELLADKKLTAVSENHQVHFFTPDIDAMQKWYVTNFGATPAAFGKARRRSPGQRAVRSTILGSK